MHTLLTAPQLAKAARTTARALRFYEDKGLLAPRRVGRRRIYDHRDRARLQLILRGKRLGFSLADIKEYLELYEVDPSHCEQIRHLAKAVGVRITALEQQQVAVEEALGELRDIQRQVINTLNDAAGDGVAGGVRPKIRPKGRRNSRSVQT